MKSATFLRFCACASSLALGVGLATGANASNGSGDSHFVIEDGSYVVVTDAVDLDTPPPGGAFDNEVDVTGVGQMVTQPDRAVLSVGLCTGTLINPRTVIFAAHCVNDAPAAAYGAASDGIPISFGFSADNLPALRSWLGLTGNTPYATDTALNIYNVEQVWYDPRSLALGPSLSFLEADIAIATLDTHADGIPTWALLFSPLTEETHAIINGYGARGVGADGANLGIDYRRRVAENMLSVLGSLDDRDEWLFGSPSGLPQNLYMLDFDSPGGVTDPDYGFLGNGFDFDLFDGPALPREGTTAGGDSGGPLIVDQEFDRPVVVGVLSGGSRFFGAQPFSSYGSQSFYQPLFMFWESIVANNPYVYASAKAGSGNWNNPNRWVQDMDPNYTIAVGGELVNALPGFAEPGVTGETPQFGNICFLDECEDQANKSVALAGGAPNSVFVPGGPGSTGFVPDNIVADPSAGVKARYYEVTLGKLGTTSLTDAKTIDRLNIEGLAHLRIRQNGDLKVWGDYTQMGGILEIEAGGQIATGEAFLGKGILKGSGLFDPTYLTNVSGTIAPGELLSAGKLTIAGDVILSSDSLTLLNLERNKSDLLSVIADADNTGAISLGGLAYMLPGSFSLPRYGKQYTIIEAEGGVQNTFDATYWLGLGILYPELIYSANNVVAKMRAGLFSRFFANAGIADKYALAFGNSFDALRATNYADLDDVFGMIDVMDVAELATTFRYNSAAMASDLAISDERQNGFVRRLVSDRLGLMGQRGTGGTMRVIGDASAFGIGQNMHLGSASQLSFAQSYKPQDMAGASLPDHVSGFVYAGYRRLNDTGATVGARDESGTWHMAMGLELAVDDRSALGTAFGYSRGERQIGGTVAQVVTSHAALYGSHQLGGGAYVGGQVSMAHSSLDAASGASFGGTGFALDSRASNYAGVVELGYNHAMGDLTLTPRTRLEYSSYAIAGFQDRQSRLAMNVDGIDRAGFDWRAGFRLSGNAKLGRAGTWTVQPEMQFDYVQRLSGNETRIDLRFLEADTLDISLPVALHDGEYGELRGGLTITDGRFSFGAALETQFGQDFYRDERGVVSVSFAF